jgi:hypothetical protein
MGVDKIEVEVYNSEVESVVLEIAAERGYLQKISAEIDKNSAVALPPSIHKCLL